LKLLYIAIEYHYTERVLDLIEQRGLKHYQHLPRVQGRDPGGRHEGSQVFPGHLALLLVPVQDEDLEAVLDDFRALRESDDQYRNMIGLVLAAEQSF
jgi:hypothetical protein